MCGITGFVPGQNTPTIAPLDAVRRITQHTDLRGPDAETVWSSDGVVLGHRRLAILDLDARSNQPMALLHALRHLHTGFTGGAGKRMLAQAPQLPLPGHIINRPKAGFVIPMTDWLTSASGRRDWFRNPLLASPGTPWTRRWAKTVLDEGFGAAA